MGCIMSREEELACERDDRLAQEKANMMLFFENELDGRVGPTEWQGRTHKDLDTASHRVIIQTATRTLCAKLRDKTPEEIREYSLELQMWWRDHQRVDLDRRDRLRVSIQDATDTLAALTKLTERERALLNVKDLRPAVEHQLRVAIRSQQLVHKCG